MFSMDIEEFIERGRQGDEDALGSLYKAYHRQMTGICQRIVGNRQVAEELAHDAFLLAFAKLDQLHNAQRFEAWLTSITTNVARRYKQRQHDPATFSLSTLSEEELPQESIQSDDKPLPTMAFIILSTEKHSGLLLFFLEIILRFFIIKKCDPPLMANRTKVQNILH